MGVKGLQYYTENHCPPACQRVSIIDMANQCRQDYNRVPILAVDGMSLLHRLYRSDNLEWLYGGQWKQYIEIFKSFVQRFRDENIELILFFDGTTEAIKTNEWISRRVEKLKDIQKIFNHIDEFHTTPDDRLNQLPSGMGTLVRFALKNVCGCNVVNSVVDADKEVAKFAFSTPHCFAILSQDTDYIIFDTKPYLSITHLDVESLETVMYDRIGLANFLDLTVPQLPMFSCLMGNDFISVETVRPLHRYLTNSRGRTETSVVVPRVAEYINYLGWMGGMYDPYKIEEIASNIGVDPSVIFNSLEFYSMFPDVLEQVDCQSVKRTVVEMVRRKHRCCDLNPQIYTLLTQRQFKSSEALEDPISTGLLPSPVIFRPMRQRWYAILFDGQDVEVEELTAIQGVPILQELVKTEHFLVNGRKPPGIQVLWNERVDPTICWNTFLTGLGLTITRDQLRNIIPQHIGLACLLNYLLLNPIGDHRLAAWELDALVAQAVSPIASNLHAIRNIRISYVDARGVGLATIVMRGLTAVLGFLQVCGEPFSSDWVMPWNCFDGKLFHHFYTRDQERTSVRDLFEEPASIRAFLELRSVIVTGTYLTQEECQS